MNRKEFAAEITGYYGNFQNEAVARLFVQTLNKINESDLDRLFDWFLVNIPANWKVDVTTLTKGVNACCIFYAYPKKHCPICNAPNREKANYCSNCGYDFSVPAESYRAMLAKPEDVAKAFSAIQSGLAEKKAAVAGLRE